MTNRSLMEMGVTDGGPAALEPEALKARKIKPKIKQNIGWEPYFPNLNSAAGKASHCSFINLVDPSPTVTRRRMIVDVFDFQGTLGLREPIG